MYIEVNIALLLAKTMSGKNLVLKIRGQMRSNGGEKWGIFFICYFDFLLVNRGQLCTFFSESHMSGENLVPEIGPVEIFRNSLLV